MQLAGLIRVMPKHGLTGFKSSYPALNLHISIGPRPKRQFKKLVLTLLNCVKTFRCWCRHDIVLMTILFNDVTVCKMTSHYLVIQFIS